MSKAEHRCRHGHSHIIDSRFHGGGYAEEATRKIFCDRCRLQRWLDVEAALARAEAELEIIPAWAALEISRAAVLDRLDLEDVAQGIVRTGHSIVPLLRALRAACEGGAGEYVHFGATTQDIQDTAQSLEMREVLDVLGDLLPRLMAVLAHLADSHRDEVAVARTHAIPALPTTIGLKISGWLDEFLRHAERLDQLRPRVLTAQLAGGVGTMAAFGPRALELLQRFSTRLGLSVPRVGWHVSRDRVAEFVFALAAIAASAARAADEIRTLCRWEIGEIELAWSPHHVGSSTMPHKRNPEACEQVVALSRLARSQVLLALDGMVAEHERDYRATRLEWCAVADVSHYTVAAVSALLRVVTELTVDVGRVRSNVQQVRDAICTEAVVFQLASQCGKESAYELIWRVCQQAKQEGRSIASAIREAVIEELGEALDEGALEPERHVGRARELIDRVLDAAGHVTHDAESDIARRA